MGRWITCGGAPPLRDMARAYEAAPWPPMAAASRGTASTSQPEFFTFGNSPALARASSQDEDESCLDRRLGILPGRCVATISR
jgi:hypothetical protein